MSHVESNGGSNVGQCELSAGQQPGCPLGAIKP